MHCHSLCFVFLGLLDLLLLLLLLDATIDKKHANKVRGYFQKGSASGCVLVGRKEYTILDGAMSNGLFVCLRMLL